MTELDGKVALVTGGGTGIGRGIALALAQAGMRVAICGRRRQPLEETVEQMPLREDREPAGLVIQVDVSLEEDVQRVIQLTLERFGQIDVLVNNAGIGGGGQIHAHDIREWDEILRVNLRGPFLMSRAVLPHMRERGGGRIILISSESGLNYYQGDGAYGISKHALNALGEYIQRENQEFGIQVNTICPGMVVSEMSIDSPGLNLEKCLQPEDIAGLVIWLLSQQPNLKIGRPVLIQTMVNPWK